MRTTAASLIAQFALSGVAVYAFTRLLLDYVVDTAGAREQHRRVARWRHLVLAADAYGRRGTVTERHGDPSPVPRPSLETVWADQRRRATKRMNQR